MERKTKHNWGGFKMKLIWANLLIIGLVYLILRIGWELEK